MRQREAELLLRQRHSFWFEGGSALPAIELLLQLGRKDDAASLARLALSRDDCDDAIQIERLLDELCSTPSGWDEALADFVASPSADRWESLVRFAPPELMYNQLRSAVRKLRQMGADPNRLFTYASQTGVTPDIIELVEDGLVAPEVVESRGNQKGAARSFWLGLAAQAAYLRGDKLGAMRYLREASAHEDEYSIPIHSVYWLRDREDEEMTEMMRSAGLLDDFEQ